MKSNYEMGTDFEKEFAKKIGAKVQPGSGNQWHSKMDLKGKSFLWSLKATKHASFSITTEIWRELIHAAHGPGGTGASTVPGLAVKMAGETFVCLRADDFIALVQEEVKIAPPSKRTKSMKLGKLSVFERKQLKEQEDGEEG